MRILSIESSCDETAAAVVENGRNILSSVVATQVEEHKLYGGVVPEIAFCRAGVKGAMLRLFFMDIFFTALAWAVMVNEAAARPKASMPSKTFFDKRIVLSFKRFFTQVVLFFLIRFFTRVFLVFSPRKIFITGCHFEKGRG